MLIKQLYNSTKETSNCVESGVFHEVEEVYSKVIRVYDTLLTKSTVTRLQLDNPTKEGISDGLEHFYAVSTNIATAVLSLCKNYLIGLSGSVGSFSMSRVIIENGLTLKLFLDDYFDEEQIRIFKNHYRVAEFKFAKKYFGLKGESLIPDYEKYNDYAKDLFINYHKKRNPKLKNRMLKRIFYKRYGWLYSTIEPDQEVNSFTLMEKFGTPFEKKIFHMSSMMIHPHEGGFNLAGSLDVPEVLNYGLSLLEQMIGKTNLEVSNEERSFIKDYDEIVTNHATIGIKSFESSVMKVTLGLIRLLQFMSEQGNEKHYFYVRLLEFTRYFQEVTTDYILGFGDAIIVKLKPFMEEVGLNALFRSDGFIEDKASQKLFLRHVNIRFLKDEDMDVYNEDIEYIFNEFIELSGKKMKLDDFEQKFATKTLGFLMNLENKLDISNFLDKYLRRSVNDSPMGKMLNESMKSKEDEFTDLLIAFYENMNSMEHASMYTLVSQFSSDYLNVVEGIQNFLILAQVYFWDLTRGMLLSETFKANYDNVSDMGIIKDIQNGLSSLLHYTSTTGVVEFNKVRTS